MVGDLTVDLWVVRVAGQAHTQKMEVEVAGAGIKEG